ncbi:MAG TPA: glycosyltransferase family 2 protein, partial [Chthoniobacterales bacterium]|nr:glycosyltransferase family 2 protein [Chthoniobacterales bacterium]
MATFKLMGRSHISQTVSVVVPTLNEVENVEPLVHQIMRSSPDCAEIIIVDDGSTDGTANEVARVGRRDPCVRLIQQANGGKAAALNNGLVQAKGDIVFTVDADTIVAPEAVGYLARHFYLDTERTLGAVAGVVRVGNRSRNLL